MINELNKKFKNQVDYDNKNYLELKKDKSQYLQNPLISASPKFLFVAMEPTKKKGESLNPKLRNFVSSIDDIIIHYCAYHYLCKEKFDYQITDVSKGAMPVKIAGKNRKKRYDSWIKLLKDEIKILDEPKIIAIGKGVASFLKNNNVSSDVDFILHYSGANNGNIKKYHDNIESKEYSFDNVPSHDDLINFTKKLFKHINYDFNTDKVLDKLSKGLSESKKKLILCYKHRFEEMLQLERVWAESREEAERKIRELEFNVEREFA